MLRYVWLDRALPDEVADSGTHAWGVFVSLLRALEQNCILVDFPQSFSMGMQDVRNAIDKSNVSAKERDSTIRLLRRVVDRRVRIGQSSRPYSIDAAIYSRNSSQRWNSAHDVWLSSYAGSLFEEKRSQEAAEGFLSDDFDSPDKFFEASFGRAVRFATSLSLYDGAMGKYFNQNYLHSMEVFLNWLRKTVENSATLRIELHCQAPMPVNGYGGIDRDKMRQTELAIRKLIRETGWQLDLYFYRGFVHDRFLLTNQIALEIGRGFDFVSRNGRLRDISLHLKSHGRLQQFLAKRLQGPQPVIRLR